MKTLLLCLDENQYTAEEKDRVLRLVPDYDVVFTRDENRIAEVIPDLEIAGGWFPRDSILDAPNLKWMQQWWAGADWTLEHPELKQRDLVVTSASGIHAVQITEHIFSFLFSFARGLPEAMRVQKSGSWDRSTQSKVFELYEKTLLIIGVGAIGSRTAEVAKALGMRVIGVRRNPEKSDSSVERMYGPDQLTEALPLADFVVVVTPLTHETRGMIGAAELEIMKQSAYIVNVGRGAAIDEQALVAALQQGTIAGAGLDAFEREPLPESSPLWNMENVIFTCHYSGMSPRYGEKAMALFLGNLELYVSEKPLQNIVDIDLGY